MHRQEKIYFEDKSIIVLKSN